MFIYNESRGEIQVPLNIHRSSVMEEGKPDTQLFQLLNHLVSEVELLSNQEEVELREKIKALSSEVTKIPHKPSRHVDEMEIAKELDNLSSKLDVVEEMISSSMATNPDVQSLLTSFSNVWLPVITATSDQRRNFSVSVEDDDTKTEATS